MDVLTYSPVKLQKLLAEMSKTVPEYIANFTYNNLSGTAA